MVELKKIATEQRNPNTMNIDTLSTLEMVKLINREDHHVAEAVALVTDKIAQAVDVIADRLGKGGRLIYCGAGTSGRLGILDAVECPPHLLHRAGNGSGPDGRRIPRHLQGRGRCGGQQGAGRGGYEGYRIL